MSRLEGAQAIKASEIAAIAVRKNFFMITSIWLLANDQKSIYNHLRFEKSKKMFYKKSPPDFSGRLASIHQTC
jgi:hypothetical protein